MRGFKMPHLELIVLRMGQPKNTALKSDNFHNVKKLVNENYFNNFCILYVKNRSADFKQVCL